MLNKKALSATAQVEKDGDFKNTVLLLHGDGTNGAQNNTFTDSSTNAFTITRNGNPTQGTFSPFSVAAGEWSNYFDGNADYFTLGTVSSFNFMHTSSALFTLEAWVFMSAPSGTGMIFNNNDLTSTKVGCGIGINSSNQIKLYIAMGSGTVVNATSTGTVTFNAWNHIAVTYDQSLSSSNATFYINGVSAGTANKSANSPSANDASYVARVGAYNTGGGDFPGYISNLRITNSIVYSSGFTPSTTPLTAITNTKLLTCQSNRFIDNSTNAFTVTVNGNPSVQAFSPFAPTAAYSAGTNGGSGYFDGTDDYLTIPDNSAFDFGSGDFTIECWYYMLPGAETAGNGRWIVSKWQTDDTTFSWGFRQEIGGGAIGKLRFYLKFSSGTTTLEASAVQQVNTWYHIAAVRNGSTLTMYINGVSDASTTVSGAVSVSTTKVAIGEGQLNTGAEAYWLGYISGLRVIKGTAQYTTGFTPPTTPPTAVTNTQLLTNFTNAGIYDSTAKNDLETVGNAQIDTTTKKFGTGSMKFDGTDDRLTNASSQLFAMGTGNFTFEGWLNKSDTNHQGIFQVSTTAGGLAATTTNTLAFGFETAKWQIYANNTDYKSSTISLTTGQWYHFALVRNSSTTKLYIDGTEVISVASDTTDYTGTNLVIGGFYNTTYLHNGYIDEVRITKGVARYTANFTAPTKAFADQ